MLTASVETPALYKFTPVLKRRLADRFSRTIYINLRRRQSGSVKSTVDSCAGVCRSMPVCPRTQIQLQMSSMSFEVSDRSVSARPFHFMARECVDISHVHSYVCASARVCVCVQFAPACVFLLMHDWTSHCVSILLVVSVSFCLSGAKVVPLPRTRRSDLTDTRRDAQDNPTTSNKTVWCRTRSKK